MRYQALSALAAAALVAACGSDGGKGQAATTAASTATTALGVTLTSGLGAAVTTPVSAGTNCRVAPNRGPDVKWLPSDFPMPPGTYVAQEVASPPTAKVATFVVPMTITQYVTYALNEFPKAGFRLGRGDSEAGEAEDSFARGSTAGAFRVRQPYCDTAKSELLLSYVPDVVAAQQASSTTASSAKVP